MIIMKIPRLPVNGPRARKYLSLWSCVSLILLCMYLPQCLFPASTSPSITIPNLTSTPTSTSTSTPTSRLLPMDYWRHRREHPEAYKATACARVPETEDIDYAAAFWQHLQLVNGSLYMYSAYWDGRFEDPLVRILVYTDVGRLPKLYCQLWYLHESAPHVVVARATYAWQSKPLGPMAAVNEPYILTCNPTFHHHNPYKINAPPVAVSVVSRPCERANNILNVQNAPSPAQPASTPSPTSVAICLKCLDCHEDISAQILEWLLLLKYFEAEVVYVYLVRAHDNVLRILNHFASIGFVRLTELTHPPWLEGGGGRRWSRWQRDILDFRKGPLSLNDCLYRSVGRHRWLVAFDTDEMIVPVRDKTYPRLLSGLLYNSVDAVACRSVFYMEAAQKDHKAPPFAKKLAHTWRARENSDFGHYVRSFHNVRTVIAMHKHNLPVVCRARCQHQYIHETSARVQNYKSKCSDQEDIEDCEKLTEDVIREATLEPWRGRLLEDIPKILTALGIPVPKEEKARD